MFINMFLAICDNILKMRKKYPYYKMVICQEIQIGLFMKNNQGILMFFVPVNTSEKKKKERDIMYNNLQGILLCLPQRQSPDSLAPS